MASFSFCNYPLEGDGFNENIFHYLWSKDERDQSPQICIPDTIIYKYRHPTYWYFTSKSGKIKRKSKFNLVNSKIEEAFTKKAYGSDILAYYISSEDAEGNGKDSLGTIEYFDREGLIDFLYNREKVNNGVLQRFVEPKELCNSLVRAVWSPKVVLLERRENIRKLNETKYSLYERAITYEGAEHNSRAAPVRGTLLPTEIQKLAKTMVDHVAEVSFGKSIVSRMAINLKIDPNDKLWFLWCSSLRLEGKTLRSSSLRVKKPSKQGPVNVDPMCRVPESIQKCISSTTASGMCTDTLHTCTSCDKIVLSDRFYNVPYKTVINHFEQVMGVIASGSGGRFVSWPPSKEIIAAIGGVGFGPLAHRAPNAKQFKDKNGTNVPQYEKEIEISPIVRQLHPSLSVLDYRRYKKDPLFQYKQVSVCENCYLVFAEVATGDYGTATPASSNGSIATSKLCKVLQPNRDSTEELWGSQRARRKRDGRIGSEMETTKANTQRKKPTRRRAKPTTTSCAGEIPNPLLAGVQGPQMPPRIDENSVKELQAISLLRQSRIDLMTPAKARPLSRSSDKSENGTDTSVSFQKVLQRREDSFFRDLYNNPNLQNGHPLSHLVYGQEQLQSAHAGIRSNAKLSGTMMLSNLSSVSPALTHGTSFERGQESVVGFGQVRSAMKSPYAVAGSKLQSKRMSKNVNEDNSSRRLKADPVEYSMVKANNGVSRFGRLQPTAEIQKLIQGQPSSRLGTSDSKSSGGSNGSGTKPKRTKKPKQQHNNKAPPVAHKALSERQSSALHRSFLLNTLQEVRTQLDANSPFMSQSTSIVPELQQSSVRVSNEEPQRSTLSSNQVQDQTISGVVVPTRFAFMSNHETYFASIKPNSNSNGYVVNVLRQSPSDLHDIKSGKAVQYVLPNELLKDTGGNVRDRIATWISNEMK